jgi:signal transduction histidine kinase
MAPVVRGVSAFARKAPPPAIRILPGISAARLVVVVREAILRGDVFFETLRRQPTWRTLLVALVLVGLIGWLDHAMSWEWSCFAPYAVPIVLVSWKEGRRWGFLFAFLCAVTYWVADSGNHPYQTEWGYALAVAGWWFYFSVLVVAAAAVRAQSEFDRVRIEALEHTHELESDVLLTSEREQQRIGRDLHDSLGPQLAATGYAATFLTNDLCRREQPEAAQAEQIRRMASDAMSLAQNLARGISPAQMDGVGLPLALEDLARTTSSQRGMAVSFHQTGIRRPQG